PDKGDMRDVYGEGVTAKEVLKENKVRAPESVREFPNTEPLFNAQSESGKVARKIDQSIEPGGGMRKLFLASFVVMALGLILTACAPSEPIDGTSKSTTKMTDSELESKIKAKFDSDAQLKAADLSVSADADKNKATISGAVGTQAMRMRA